MKRVGLWVVGAGVTSVALMLALRAQEQQAGKAATAPSQAAASAAAPGNEKIAFTFADDTQLQQFAQLWQQRQATLAKMAVLQSYWREEQGNLNKVSQELLARYNIDVSKNYQFDPTRKVLIEREAAPQPPAELGGAPAPVQGQSQADPAQPAAQQPAQGAQQ
jgi:hypothetical protein